MLRTESCTRYLLSLISFLLVAWGFGPILSDREFKEIGEMATEITARHPAHESMIVGVGRSPTALIAYLKQLRPETGSVRNLPLSAFRHCPKGHTPLNRAENLRLLYEPLNQAEETELFSHFDRFLPSESERKGRGLVFVDFSQSGDSMVALKLYLDRYFAARWRIAPPITLIAFAGQFNQERIKKRGGSENVAIEVIPIGKENEVFAKMNRQGYDTYSEFGSYHPKNFNSKRLTSRPAYKRLSEELTERLHPRPVPVRTGSRIDLFLDACTAKWRRLAH